MGLMGHSHASDGPSMDNYMACSHSVDKDCFLPLLLYVPLL